MAELDSIDFSECPIEFAKAFERHRDAWEGSIPFFERFGHLRGELHELFEQIRNIDEATEAALKAHENQIWGTWAEVEAAAAKEKRSTEM